MSEAQRLGFTAEEEQLALIFLRDDANGFGEQLAMKLLGVAMDLARYSDIPLARAVEAVVTGLNGHPRRLRELGFDVSADPGVRSAVLHQVREKVSGRAEQWLAAQQRPPGMR